MYLIAPDTLSIAMQDVSMFLSVTLAATVGGLLAAIPDFMDWGLARFGRKGAAFL